MKWHQMSGVLKPRRENERERRKRRGTIKPGNQFFSVSIGNSGDRTTKPIRIALLKKHDRGPFQVDIR